MKVKLRFFKAQKLKVSLIFALVMLACILPLPDKACAQGARSQHDEVGVFAGVGFYNGEINPSQLIYNPKPALGFNLRHVFSNRIGVSFQTVWCKLAGDDADFDSPFQQQRGASFENEVVEMSLQGELNFLPLIPGDDRHCFTPYVAGGPGLTVASFPGEGLRFCVPFGVGIKYCPNEVVTLSAEWKYRRLFSDLLDNIGQDYYDISFGENAAKQRSFMGNDDWYSFIGVVLSFKIGSRHGQCQAYK